MARIVPALLLAAATLTEGLAVGTGVTRLKVARVRAAPAMQALFSSDEDSEADGHFSDESTRRMADRLNGMLGLPQDKAPADATSPQSSVLPPARSASESGIPFIDTHFPSRRAAMKDAVSTLGELANGLQDLQSLPRIGVQIDEDEGGYTVSVTCSDFDVSEQQLEVALGEGVLLLTLVAMDSGSKVLVPVPLPADAGSEIASLVHDDGKITMRVDKDPTRASDAADSAEASSEEESQEVLDRLTRVLKAFGLNVNADDASR